MTRLAERVYLASASESMRLPLVLQRALLVAGGYYIAGLASLLFKLPPSGISVVWLATAVLLAALLLTSPRYWWIYLLCIVPAHLHLVTNFQRPEPTILVALCQVASNTAEAVLAAMILRFVIGGPPRFDRFRDVVAFILIAGIGTTAAGSAIAVSLFLLTGRTTDFWMAWSQRARAGGLGIIMITPLIVLACTDGLVGRGPTRRRSWIELGLLVIALFAVGVPALRWTPSGPGYVPALMLAPLPLLLLAAVRLGPGALSITLLIVAVLALVNGHLGKGPFVIQSSAENVLSLQIFLLAISIPLMLLAALVEERRRAERSLEQSEAQMAFAAAATDTGLWQYDIATRQVWATEYCRSMFGLDAEAVLDSKSFLEAVHPADRISAMAAIQAAQPEGEAAWQSEFRVVHPDKGVRWYLATASTEHDENAQPVRISGIFTDITSRKNADHEAEQLEDALRTTRTELERVTRQTTMGAMVGSIAHEINQPLSAIVTNGGIGVRLLEKSGSDLDEIREVLKRIIDDGHRASHIISSIRAMLAKDPGEKSLIGIHDVVREVLAVVQGELANHRVSVVVELQQQLPMVLADRVQLQQVMLNLIMNAVEAMASRDQAERSLHVKAEIHEERNVLVTVEDSGPGIDADDMERIFDPFFTTKPRGMGLGLSISRSIIEAHGGRLSASRRYPRGTAFQVHLPGGDPVGG